MSPRLLRLYPGWWRRRYGEEILAVMADRPPVRGDRMDLLRGAADAWLHPASPSWVAPIASLSGGGLWTVVAAATVAQPTPPDWPGYLHELVPLALAAASLLLIAILGCALRAGHEHWRSIVLASSVVLAGSVGWIGAQLLTWAAIADPATLAVTQGVAMIGTIAVGIVLLRAGDSWVGSLLVVAGGVMLVPWTGAWLAFGAAWTAIGVVLVVDRLGRVDRGLRAA
jgi:hypothetical protein